MDIVKQLVLEYSKKESVIKNIIKLLDEGDTVPFISRYRKELVGEIDSESLYEIEDRLNYLRNLEKRKQSIKKLMTEREQLTEELEKKIDEITVLSKLEELYEPFFHT